MFNNRPQWRRAPDLWHIWGWEEMYVIDSPGPGCAGPSPPLTLYKMALESRAIPSSCGLVTGSHHLVSSIVNILFTLK